MKDVKVGMKVRSSDGANLGKVTACERDYFVIEKGFFFPKDYSASYGEVAGIEGEEIRLAATGAELGRPIPGTKEETRVPLSEEEIIAEKRSRDAGEVRVHKEVKTEVRQVSVPVMKEEVRVERVPASGKAAPGEAFKEETTTVPLHEEEVEIHKRAVVREEVRITKEQSPQEYRADVEVRKEQASIEGETDPKRKAIDPDKER